VFFLGTDASGVRGLKCRAVGAPALAVLSPTVAGSSQSPLGPLFWGAVLLGHSRLGYVFGVMTSGVRHRLLRYGGQAM